MTIERKANFIEILLSNLIKKSTSFVNFLNSSLNIFIALITEADTTFGLFTSNGTVYAISMKCTRFLRVAETIWKTGIPNTTSSFWVWVSCSFS